MPEHTVVTAVDAERYEHFYEAMERADGPAFLSHDSTLVRYWQRLEEVFPTYQFCLVDASSGRTAGIGRSIPLNFSGEWEALPDEGFDWVLEKGFQDRATGLTPNLASALYIEIAAGYRGRGLSAQMVLIMRQIAKDRGFGQLIAPVRPSLKSRYPLIEIDTYLAWHIYEGLPLDPWLRVHVRLGGQIVRPCRRAMSVVGTRDEWAEWTEMSIPGDGDYVIPYGLVPLQVRSGKGTYVEPGVWVLHHL